MRLVNTRRYHCFELCRFLRILCDPVGTYSVTPHNHSWAKARRISARLSSYTHTVVHERASARALDALDTSLCFVLLCSARVDNQQQRQMHMCERDRERSGARRGDARERQSAKAKNDHSCSNINVAVAFECRDYHDSFRSIFLWALWLFGLSY